MAKSALYTGTGDLGTTSLVGGERVLKTSLRLEAYGTIDELSSFIGAVLSEKDCPESIREQLLTIQTTLFDLGSYLASNPESTSFQMPTGVEPEDIATLESWIDNLDEATPRVKAFVLPGGSPLAAKAHQARTVCRRAERCILRLAEHEKVDPIVIKYVNRLSDYLFILARNFNHIAGIEEIIWRPKKRTKTTE